MGQIDVNPPKQRPAAGAVAQDGLHSEKPQQTGNPVEPVRVKLQDPVGYLSDGLMASSVWSAEGIASTPRLFQRRGRASNNNSPINSPEHPGSSRGGATTDYQSGDNQCDHLSSFLPDVTDEDARASWTAQSAKDEKENDQVSENQQLEASSFPLVLTEEAETSHGSRTPGEDFDWKSTGESFERHVLGNTSLTTLSATSSPDKSDSRSLSDSSFDTDSGFGHPGSIHSRSSSRSDLQDSSDVCPPPPGLSLMDRIQEDFPRTPSPVFGSFASNASKSFAVQECDKQLAEATRSMGQLRLGNFKEFTMPEPVSYTKYPVDNVVRRQQRPPHSGGYAPMRNAHPFSPAAHHVSQSSFPSAMLSGFSPQPTPMALSGYASISSPSASRWFPSNDRYGVPESPFLAAPGSLSAASFDPACGVSYRVGTSPYAHDCGTPFNPGRSNDRIMRPSFPMSSSLRDESYERMDQYSRRPPYNRFKSPVGRRNDHEYFHPVAHSYSSNSLLEEFNSTPKSDRWELSTIKGHLLIFAKDQSGSRFIQQKLEKADERTKHDAFMEIYPNCLILMTDVFGNYVVQKFLEYGSQQQQKLLVEKMKENMISLALQVYGCRVIQRALEVAQVEEQLELIRQLHGHVMKCVIDQNGNHVLQKCVEAASWKKRMERGELHSSLPSVTGADIQFIVDSFVGHAAQLSTHSYGCRVVQRVLEHCSPEQIRPILNEIIFKCRDLIKDQFGNYVVQHVVSHGDPEQQSVIKQTVFPDIARWSQHKYASNVVEACLEHASKAEISHLVDFILQCDETGSSCALLPMMKHMYGNYVVQKLLDRADEHDRERIVCIIRHNADYLKRFTFGKHVLSRLERDSSPVPPAAFY